MPAGTGERRFRRRRFLAGAATGAAALALPAWLRPRGGSGLFAQAASHHHRKPKRPKLRIPAEITDATIEIPVVPRKIQILPGRKTAMWTYDGQYPGPTIRRPAGEATSITFHHELPSSVGELTTHIHGGHNRSDDDGRPGGLTSSQKRSLYCDVSPNLSARASGNDVLIEPGASRTYNFEGIEDGEPERGCMQWYHDHRLDHTARNSWHGLTGMWIIDEPAIEGPLNLPSGGREIPLMITDRTFDSKNQLTDPFKHGGGPPVDQNVGKTILVNGATKPYKSVSARRYRLRLLNTSGFRSFNLQIEGLKMLQIATESGLMPKAISRKKILIGPAERVEVIVDFSKARGKHLKLKSVRRAGKVGKKLGSKPYEGELMEFRVSNSKSSDSTSTLAQLQARRPLRALPQWAQDAAAAPPSPTHTWKIQISGLPARWKINGRTFNPAYTDVQATLGETVVWRLRNTTGVGHLLHLHHTDWYMLSRNGKTPPAYERCLKETFFLDPHDEVVIAGKISGGADPLEPSYAGPYVVHCHMLDHEDHGLMSQFEVVAPARS